VNGATQPLPYFLRRVLSRRLDSVSAKFEARLPSEIPEAQFQVVIETTWPPGADAGRSVRSLATQLLHVARQVANDCSVLDKHEAWAAIERALLGDVDVQGSGLTTLTVTSVMVNPADQNLAEQQEVLRRETALTHMKAEKLRALLANPITARLWWLEDRPDKLERLVEQKMDGIFEKISALFGESASRPAADPIAELIGLFLQGLDGRFRERLIDQLRIVFTAYERPDLAGRLDDHPQPRTYPGCDAGHPDLDGNVSGPALA
jgi:hypothetical protein